MKNNILPEIHFVKFCEKRWKSRRDPLKIHSVKLLQEDRQFKKNCTCARSESACTKLLYYLKKPIFIISFERGLHS